MELFTVPDGRDPLEHRAEMIGKYGVRALDMVRPIWTCSGCRRPVPTDVLILPAVAYRTLDQARQYFDGFVREIAEQKGRMGAVPGQELAVRIELPHGRPLLCPACSGSPALSHTDVHLHSSSLGRDLVLRFAPNAAPQLGALAPNGAIAPLAWTRELESAFGRDAIVRALEVAREDKDVARCAEVLAEAAQRVPGDPDVIRFLPWLNNRGAWEAILGMADATMRAQPSNAEGFFWRAQVLVQQAGAGRAPPGANEEAKRLLEHATRLAPDHADAHVALANVARVAGRDDEATAILQRLLSRVPDHGVANYTLGLVLLPKNPAAALACFERGERSSPDDPDFPRSRARALLALGRTAEAQAAIQKARELGPDDPNVAAVASQIQGQNPIARTIKIIVWLTLAFVLILIVAIVAWSLYEAGVFG